MGVLTAIILSRWARRLVIGIALIGAVLLFLLNLRRVGETAGRHAERLKQMERQNDIQRHMLEAASNRPRNRDDLTACATGGSDRGSVVCPPVVTYDQAVRDRAAAELEALPEDAALVEMMADYAVMRAQVRACAS